jgi:Flavin containing amine oxidoreductase
MTTTSLLRVSAMGRLFFAGEATTRCYPATMHGAFLTDLREAVNITNHATSWDMQSKVDRNPSLSTESCAALLADLFRESDLESGGFSIFFGGKASEPKSPAVLKVLSGRTRKKGIGEGEHSNKLLFQIASLQKKSCCFSSAVTLQSATAFACLYTPDEATEDGDARGEGRR